MEPVCPVPPHGGFQPRSTTGAEGTGRRTHHRPPAQPVGTAGVPSPGPVWVWEGTLSVVAQRRTTLPKAFSPAPNLSERFLERTKSSSSQETLSITAAFVTSPRNLSARPGSKWP